ncbi:cation:proton antiporter [Burkholderia cenocepacia]|uniref:cation:proton antiporter domain-containing protein n=1 Tax=Burkholderia cepacia complex TaxID=87882 RepID=UPI000F574B93|nr:MULTISPECIES: cation:proton antiporter [Burkholderia cepacia complex]ELW9449780.1 cation:proton antiporter [Burkholderia cenocepacia]MBR8486079.1 cation:proton antiporter [Burkholderia cenocepacia]MDN7471421.1 cation:proton antiporter [Burkholderia orbicola]MDN7501242.1 cation:proton antiporter [Burkholderia orbicola]RQU18885.1 cation transporter [Burkholderia cenocepacia]
MHETLWYLIIGAVLLGMGVVTSALRHLPCSSAMIYLVLGIALGPAGAGLLHLDLERDGQLLREIVEVALLVSLFAIGLRLRVPLSDKLWLVPCRLGLLAMIVTVPLLAACAVLALGLGWGPALLLAAILAPTDPVLAHDVQVHDPGDRDLVRFALSGEGGMNDGIALPFALAGLALCGAPDATYGIPPLSGTFALVALWGIAGAAAIGGGLGWATTKTIGWLRTRHAQALGLEGFFALALIVLSFGAAQLAHTFGFIATFAAGVAMRRVEHRASGDRPPREVIGQIDSEDVVATEKHPEKAHAFMAESVLGFTIELERIAEAIVMTMIGSVLSTLPGPLLTWGAVALAAVLFVAVRPLAVLVTLAGSRATHAQRRLMAWFGIRGIGSFYYLLFALEHGPSEAVRPLAAPVLAVVSASVVAHGISATPLMNWYYRLQQHRR